MSLASTADSLSRSLGRGVNRIWREAGAVIGGIILVLFAAAGIWGALVRMQNAMAGTAYFSLPSTIEVSRQGQLDPEVVGASIGSINLDFKQLAPEAASFFIGSNAVTVLCLALPALAILFLCYRLVRGVPFGVWVTRTMWIAGLVSIFGSILVCLLEGNGQHAAVSALTNLLTVDSPIGLGSADFYAMNAAQYQIVPFGIGVLALLLAVVFRKGGRLADESAGLV